MDGTKPSLTDRAGIGAQNREYHAPRPIRRDAAEGEIRVNRHGMMNFDRLVQVAHNDAAVQMGAGTAPNEQATHRILGARQSIDMLSVLDEKTKGNLTSRRSGCCRMPVRFAHVVL